MLLDLKFTLRSLLKTPAFTAVAVATVALGIGATVAIFSVAEHGAARAAAVRRACARCRTFRTAPAGAAGRRRRLALAPVGIYGVTAYSVAQRTRKFGIRVALGARPATVLATVLGRGALLTGCGVLLGVVGGLLLTRLLSGFLFGVATSGSTFVARRAE